MKITSNPPTTSPVEPESGPVEKARHRPHRFHDLTNAFNELQIWNTD